MSVTRTTRGCGSEPPAEMLCPSPEIAATCTADAGATWMRAYAVSYRLSDGIAERSSTPARSPAIGKVTLDMPGGRITDAGTPAAPVCVTIATVNGVGDGVSTESVAVALRPAMTPAAGKTERRRLCRRAVSAAAWFPVACGQYGSEVALYVP